MALTGILNTARTLKQGATMHISKEAPEYIEAINYIGLNEGDMRDEGLNDGDMARVVSGVGEVTVRVKKMDVQSGSFFMPVSYMANHVVSAQTHGSGVPGFKTTQVVVTKVNILDERN